MLTGENVSAVHGNAVMSSKLAITAQAKGLEIFVDGDDSSSVLGI